MHDPDITALSVANAGIENRHVVSSFDRLLQAARNAAKVCDTWRDCHAGITLSSALARRKQTIITCLQSLQMPHPGNHMHVAPAGGKIWDGESACIIPERFTGEMLMPMPYAVQFGCNLCTMLCRQRFTGGLHEEG